MGRRKEIASEYKEKIHMLVRKYMAKPDEMQYNTGQLHFLKGIFTSNISVASPIQVKKPENILKHLDRTILNKSPEEICSIFDKEGNLEAFLRSPYFLYLPNDVAKLPDYIHFRAEPNEEALPFLFIQQAQSELEKALRHYIALVNKEEHGLEKNKAFLELLYSTALYEIFLKEYEERLSREPRYAQVTLKLDQVENLLQCDAWDGVQRLIHASIKSSEQSLTLLVYGYCVMYHVKHMINLFAVFRILMFIEYVSLNQARRSMRGESGIFFDEAKKWKKQVQKWKKNDLFLPLKNNRNLYVLHNELNRICLKYKLYPHYIEKNGRTFQNEADGFRNDFMQYIEAVDACQKFSADHRPKEEEEKLWGAAEQMSQPILFAMEEIFMIQENAKGQKAQNAENSWKRRQKSKQAE